MGISVGASVRKLAPILARHAAFGALASIAALLLAGCGTLPQQVDRPESVALQPSPESPLVRIAQASIPAPELSGFRLMPQGPYSLDARIQLVRAARQSLDVQYYYIHNDRSGRLLLWSLRDAALRGVRVRLLVDDLHTTGNDELFRTISALDTQLFDAYNRCDLEKLGGFFTEDLEFYHDQTGLSRSRQAMVDAVKKNICGKVRRDLVPGTLEVYPLKGYGAVEIGVSPCPASPPPPTLPVSPFPYPCGSRPASW